MHARYGGASCQFSFSFDYLLRTSINGGATTCRDMYYKCLLTLSRFPFLFFSFLYFCSTWFLIFRVTIMFMPRRCLPSTHSCFVNSVHLVLSRYNQSYPKAITTTTPTTTAPATPGLPVCGAAAPVNVGTAAEGAAEDAAIVQSVACGWPSLI